MPKDPLLNAVQAYLRASDYVDECHREGCDDFAAATQTSEARRALEEQLRKQKEDVRHGLGAVRVILVAVHDSEQDRCVAERAAALAGQLSARMLIVHVIEPMVLASELGYATVADFDHARRVAITDIESVRRHVSEMADVAIETMIREGDPASEVLEAAATTHTDLIVVGTHGAGRIEQFLLGSVSSTIIRKADVPVLVVGRKVKPVVAPRVAAAAAADPVAV